MSGPRPAHLLRRGAVYSVRFRVPADLRGKIGMVEFTRSLHTSDPAEARKRCLGATAWFRSTIVRLRYMPSPSRADLEDAAVAYFAELAAELDQSRNFRMERLDEEIGWNLECSRGRIKELDEQLLLNAFDDKTKKRACGLADSSGWTLADLDERKQLFVLQLAARAEREQMQLLIHMLSKPHRGYTAEDELFQQTAERPLIEGPSRGRPIRQELQLTLREAVTDFIGRQNLRNLGKSQIEELSRALLWLREEVGDMAPLASVGTVELRKFRDDLARLDVTLRGRPAPFKQRLTNVADRQIKSVTAQRYWRSVQAFFAWCDSEQLIGSDPAASLKLDRKKGQVSRTPPPFTEAELQRLFKTPLFAGYLSPNRVGVAGNCRKRGGHWWSGVLLLFTGLRAGELSQLLPGDFAFDADIPHLKVREIDDDGRRVKSTKNEASVRDVPLHDTLLKLGLREFVMERSKIAPKGRVFREFRLGTKGRKSDGLTKFWAAYLRKSELWREGRSTHVFRHTVIAFLRANDMPVEDIAAFVGHAGKTVTAGYGGAFPLARKLRTVQKLNFGFDVVGTLGGAYDKKRHV